MSAETTAARTNGAPMTTMTPADLTRTDRLFVQHAEGEPSFVTRRIGGETIVVPVSSRVGDLDAIYTFNEVGSRIWSLLETPTAIDTLVAVLSAEYDAPAEQVASDVRELLTTLQEKALIHTVDRPTAS